jgi:hypothetical protein
MLPSQDRPVPSDIASHPPQYGRSLRGRLKIVARAWLNISSKSCKHPNKTKDSVAVQWLIRCTVVRLHAGRAKIVLVESFLSKFSSLHCKQYCLEVLKRPRNDDGRARSHLLWSIPDSCEPKWAFGTLLVALFCIVLLEQHELHIRSRIDELRTPDQHYCRYVGVPNR